MEEVTKKFGDDVGKDSEPPTKSYIKIKFEDSGVKRIYYIE